MIYLKTKLENGEEVKIDVYGDEFYCLCPECGKEVNLDEYSLRDIVNNCGCDFGSVSIFCEECSKHRLSLKPFKCIDDNRHVLTDVFDKISDQTIKDELYLCLDVYDRLIHNDIEELDKD